jgi:serine O-acetyltransferase
MKLFNLIRSDIVAKADWLYGQVTGRTILKTLFTDGTAAMILFRLMEGAQRVKLAPLAMLFNKLNVIFGHCIIGRGATFGPGFVLIHSQGVVINTAVRGGCRIRIEHQVTIGAEKGRAPVLGDDIFIGAGAKVIGGGRIGNGVKIGANAVVVDSAPDGATMVGIPARPVERERSC